MSLHALDRLVSCHEAMIAALDANDLTAIEDATAALAFAVEGAREIGQWRADPKLKERLTSLATLAQAAQIRVNFLTDNVRRRIDAIAALRGREPALTYQPGGR